MNGFFFSVGNNIIIIFDNDVDLLWTNFSPPQYALCQVWLKMAELLWKFEKFTDGQTDTQSVMLYWAFSSGELKPRRERESTMFYVIGQIKNRVGDMV